MKTTINEPTQPKARHKPPFLARELVSGDIYLITRKHPTMEGLFSHGFLLHHVNGSASIGAIMADYYNFDSTDWELLPEGTSVTITQDFTCHDLD